MSQDQTQPKLLLPAEYLAVATDLIREAKSRVYLIGLTIFRDDTTQDFVDAIIAAASRGVDVHVAADFMTFTYSISGLKSIPLTYRSNSVRQNRELAKRFTDAGAHFRWLGQYYGPMFMSRTHSKWLVVDDVAFSFGGVNTESVAFNEHVDYMFRIDDPNLANLLVREHLSVEKADRARETSRNHRAKINLGTVLFDGGKPGRSIIYNTAANLAKQAREITLVSQYCPTGVLGKTLSQKPSRIYFNQLENVDSKLNRLMIRLGKRGQREQNLYTHKKYLHAKFIIFTMPDGSRKAITGSHNFVAASSRLGTREIALLTDNEAIISQLANFLDQYVK
jgi:cardiolipin synthase